MVISITPGSRDSFNDLSKLKIYHKKGIISTPNRTVMKYDINAKNRLGADIPLTRSSKCFTLQEIIDAKKLKRILTENGYMSEVLSSVRSSLNRIGTPESLVFFYPSLTNDALSDLLKYKKQNEYTNFFCDISNFLGLESIMLPTFNDPVKTVNIVKKKNLQWIPVMNLNEKNMDVFTSQFNDCISIGEQDVPILSFKFVQYPSANKAYDLIMDNFDNMHEKGIASMIVDAPRMLYYPNSLDVSTSHYGSFLTADLISEKYTGGGGSSKKTPRLFCRNDLVTSQIDLSEDKFDLDKEIQVFDGDSKLQDLLRNIADDALTKKDWKEGRPKYLSRVHENVQTRTEFKDLQKNIDSNSAKDYLEDKTDMNTVVSSHLQKRLE
ncbi:hypothetical protein [Nitrosopumilus sp.]|uniref:hypothetical protein n=1 Tax=Nitrosopumilus sp. TaxID=2024843 RepID=UPI0029317AF4|nr:hypothetical protein [Nitrosopumilus sp.]